MLQLFDNIISPIVLESNWCHTICDMLTVKRKINESDVILRRGGRGSKMAKTDDVILERFQNCCVVQAKKCVRISKEL